MAAIDGKELDNFISVALGLKFCVFGLQDFVLDTIETAHQNILQRIPSGLKCTINCSRKFGNNFSQWCNICKSWKEELRKYCRYKKQWDKINWKEIDTIDFPHSTPDSYEAISKVFVRDVHQFRQGIFQDLGAIISLFMNMKIFIIDQLIIKDIQRHRNHSFAHNYRISVDETEKKMCLKSFIRILKVPNIFGKTSAKVAVDLLAELVTTEGIPTCLLQHQAARETFILVRDSIEQLSPCADLQKIAFVSARNTFKDRINTMILESTIKPKKIPKNISSRLVRSFLKDLSSLILLISITSSFLFPMQLDPSNEGCLSMRFSEHWKSELDFDLYVQRLNNESIINRQWLKDTVDTHLLEANGFLLTADMGYGKSSIISNIVCANRSSTWYDFRKKVIAYHFCRHDMTVTLNAGTFIRNLASAIVKLYPKMGNAILADDIAVDFLYGTRCNKDPISCFEMSILNPLQGHWNNEEFIILIDALDECASASRNNLFHFLSTQIQIFPPNFKFILTSRNIDNIYKKFQFLDKMVTHIYLNTLDSYNLKDVQSFVRKTSQLTEPQITTLTKTANGNFLHVKLFLENCRNTDTFDVRDVPNSLAHFYELNFNRIFEDSGNLFNDFLPVFEVLCTIQNPIDKDQLIEVSQIHDNRKKRQLEMLLGKELGHFLVFEDGKMSFLHKSISDFLTDERRNTSKCFVHKENGHKLFAENLLDKFKINSTSKHKLTELIHHVAMSKNIEFETRLFRFVKDLLKRDNSMLHLELLFQVVWKYNDYHTTDLLLNYIGVAAINTVNTMGQSPAFIAASQGNEKTLRCLLHNGANYSFSVVHNYSPILNSSHDKDKNTHIYTSMSTTHDIVKLCKYLYFCGYNMFHIAAQNGHTYVAEMLLQQYRYLIYSENDMHLNAFHLAVEHGQLDIVKLLLIYNKSFSDTHSLYKASEKGHTQIVRLLLDTGIKDECLSCNGIFYWLPLLSNRQQQTIKFNKIRSGLTRNQDVHIKTFFYDDWRLITCETALNTAVRNGHLSIVKILLRQKNSAINCTTYDGKTPLMTAVRHNRADIFYHLYLNGANLTKKCVHSFNIFELRAMLDIFELDSLTSEQCPVGASLAHVVAMHGTTDMILFMHNHEFRDWEQRDADEATPLHYAFCYYNYIFIGMTLRKNNFNFSATTVNGSSVFHSSAICRSFTLYIFHNSNDEYHLNVPDSLDHRGRSILHYSMILPLRQKDDSIDVGVEEHEIILTIFQVCLHSRHNLLRTDNEGRNFLHHAAKSGIYVGFEIAFKMLSDYDVKRLLTQKDATKKTPVDEIFHSMHTRQSFDPLRIPKGCSITDVFYTKCSSNFKTFLTNHELCMLKTLMYLKQMDWFVNFNVSDLLTIAIRKSRIYPVLMLKIYAEEQFQHIVHSNPPLLQFITEYEGPNIAEFFLTKNNSLKCDGSLSPLHEIVLNDRNTQAMYHNSEFLNKYLKDYSGKMLDNCYDKDGYNLLHRAAMGGNLLGTLFLLNKGMTVSHLSRQDQSALNILVLNGHFLDNGKIPLRHGNSFPFQVLQFVSENRAQQLIYDYRSAQKYDETAEFLLDNLYTSKGIRRRKIKTLLCESNVSHLSLVHLAAAKGFIEFLKKCTLLFGSDILDCFDFNKISPHYLAKIYKQDSVMKWMESIRVSQTKPTLEIESLLIYEMLFNHKVRHIYDWTCRLQYSFKHYGLIQTQHAKCRREIGDQEHYILYRNSFRETYISGLHVVLRFMNSFQIEPVMGLCNFDNTMHICSALVDKNNLSLRQLKLLQKQAYIRLRKWMKFGDHDHMFLYQSALRHIFKEPERKYLKELSFDSIVSHQVQYLEQLGQKDTIHIQWLAHFMKHLEDNHEISARAYSKYEQNIATWLNLNVMLPELQSQYEEKCKLYTLKLEAYENNNDVCQSDDVKNSIDYYREICSVDDVLNLNFVCEMHVRNHGKIHMSTAEIQRDRQNFIAYLEKEARVNPHFKERLKLYQKNMSIILYFMQFVKTDIQSSLCMRILIAQAKYAAKMKL